MKWETVKRQVADGVRQMIIEMRHPDIMTTMLQDMVASGKFTLAHQAGPLYGDEAHRIIMNWDVRAAGRLRDLFGGWFPRSLRKGELVVYMADNKDSDWMIERKVYSET